MEHPTSKRRSLRSRNGSATHRDQPKPRSGGSRLLGRFTSLISPVGSTFRASSIHPCAISVRWVRLLLAFAENIAAPIRKDGKEHIEYVPTQIVL